MYVFFFQAEDGIRDLVRSRGLGDVYKRQVLNDLLVIQNIPFYSNTYSDHKIYVNNQINGAYDVYIASENTCLLYTSDAADERSSVDLGGRRIIKKKKNRRLGVRRVR